MKILITGGSGFIGTHLLLQLLSSNQASKIVNLDLRNSVVQDERLETINVDIRHNELKNLALEYAFDVCIHLAALSKEPGFEWNEYFETNHIGTINTIALCERLDINTIMFTSTMMVYQASDLKRTERSITSPDTAYGISKLLAEKELESWKFKDLGKRSLKIIRPAVVFGENENANFTRLYRSIKRGVFPYVGRSTTIKSNIYVKELVLFVGFLLKTPTKKDIYNFSFPEENSIKQIIKSFKEVFGFKSIHPVFPLSLLIGASYIFEFLNRVGLKNGIHHRRIEKLYYSSNIFPENAINEGYKFSFDLKSSLADWKASGKLS